MLRRRLPFAVVESAPSCWSPRLDPGALRATACLKWSTGSTSSPPSRGSGQRVDVGPSSRAMQPNSCNRCGKGGDYQLACTMGRAWRTRQHFKCPGWITSGARSRRFANCKGGMSGGRNVTFGRSAFRTAAHTTVIGPLVSALMSASVRGQHRHGVGHHHRRRERPDRCTTTGVENGQTVSVTLSDGTTTVNTRLEQSFGCIYLANVLACTQSNK